MGTTILGQLQKLPESSQQKALRYVEALVAEHEQGNKGAIIVNRQTVFGIWKGQVQISEDFDDCLDDLEDYL